MRLSGLLFLAGLLTLGAGARADTGADAERLLAETWARLDAASPLFMPGSNVPRHGAAWPDVSSRALEAAHREDRRSLRALERLDREALPAALTLDLALTERLLAHRIAAHRAGEHLLVMHALEGVQLLDTLPDRLTFTRLEDFEAWRDRLEGLDTYVQQTILLMRQGMRRGVVMPQAAIRRVPAQVRALIQQAPEDTGFYRPFTQLPGDIHPARAQALRSEALHLIETRVLPAYQRLHDFLVEEYLPLAPADPGLGSQRDGPARYLRLVEWHTRPGLTPEQLHRQGLTELSRLGDVPAPGQDAPAPPEEATAVPQVLQRYRATAKRLDAALPRLFERLPGTPYGLEPLAPALAAHADAALYEPPSADGRHAGILRLNSRFTGHDDAAASVLLARHGAPGRHLALALPLETSELRAFRRHYPVSAFTEGWSLYAATLLPELGLFDAAATERALALETLTCTLDLVVDTGVHAMGWTRAEALAKLREHLPLTEEQLAVRVDGYIARPAESLACAVGAWTFEALRSRAADRLGARFDIRGFHAALLGHGALPLDVLVTRIDAWIDRQLQNHGEHST